MVKKKKTKLPKNFEELAKANNLEALESMYDVCELSATYDGKYSLNTALHYRYVPYKLVSFLVEKGLDVDIENYYGNSPLYEHASYGSDIVEYLVKLGANLDKSNKYKDSPLHIAASSFKVDTVSFLVNKGANVHAQNIKGLNALELALFTCSNINLKNMSLIAAILLDANVAITDNMKNAIKRLGENFEFHRESFNKDYLKEAEEGLNKLYTLFNVEAIARRKIHDGISPIIVTDAPLDKQFKELWDLLVPSSKCALTVQGEVIRITGRIYDEFYRNGGANFDNTYKSMLKALLEYFTLGSKLADADLKEAKSLISSIKKDNYDERALERLCELAVLYVSKNTKALELNKVAYDR